MTEQSGRNRMEASPMAVQSPFNRLESSLMTKKAVETA